MSTNNKVVALVGPTGSGKTAAGVALAKQFDGVLISADSRQVYRGLDIGTNKEGAPGSWQEEPARCIDSVPQLLVDFVAPGSRFTLHDWLSEARRLLVKIWAADHLPIIVGGTGLYVTALLDGYRVGGGRFATTKEAPTFRSCVLMPDVSRDTLYDRSDQRFERIFDALVKETKALVEQGVTHEWLQSIGLDYRFASYYLTRRMNRELAITEFQQSSRNYIRRQLTWWRHHNHPETFSDLTAAARLVEQFANGS